MLQIKPKDHPFARPIMIRKNNKGHFGRGIHSISNLEVSTIKQQQKGQHQSKISIDNKLTNMLQTVKSKITTASLRYLQIIQKKQSNPFQNNAKKNKKWSLNELILNSYDYDLIKQTNPTIKIQNKQLSELKPNPKVHKRSSSSYLIHRNNKKYNRNGYSTSYNYKKHKSIDYITNKQQVKGWEQIPYQHFDDLF